ncbi:MAG: hypothetical protein ACYC5N_01270 [Endomicrobiales bacterium]
MNLKLLFVVLFMCGGSLSGTDSIFASQTVVPYFPTGFEQTGFSFAGLDARDADNRPVRTSLAREELESIFQSSLYHLLVCAETYTIARALASIRKKLNLDTQSLVRQLPPALGRMLYALCAPQKRSGQDVLMMLSVLLACAMAVHSFVLSLFHHPSAGARMPLLFVRC